MKYKILLTIFAICLASSLLLTFTPVEKICGDQTSGCSIVQNSQYKKTLGINNSYFGIIAFTILITITISHMQNPKRYKKIFLTSLTIISALVAIYFIYLQIFVIKAFCTYCMIVDIGVLFALIITVKKY